MTNLIDKLKTVISPDLTNMLTSHNQSGEAHADIRQAIANAGGAIEDEDLYLKAQFICTTGPYTITTTKKSFLLDETHNNIVETIYFNEPITYQNEDNTIDIYNDDNEEGFEVVYRENDPNELFSALNIADDIDVAFVIHDGEKGR